MKMRTVNVETGRRVPATRTAAAVAVISLAALGAGVAVSLGAGAAVASAGAVTFVDPATNSTLSGTQSAIQVFSANLPLAAACPGNTANNAYHVYSFMVPAGTDPSTVSFVTGTPSSGLGYFDASGYQGPINTATSGQVVGLPKDLQWSTYPGPSADLTGGSSKSWDSGWACADGQGVVQRYWDQIVTFAATSTGFTWTAGAVAVTTTTSSTSTTSTTVPHPTTTLPCRGESHRPGCPDRTWNPPGPPPSVPANGQR